MKSESAYRPVNPDFYEVITSEKQKNKISRIHYFMDGTQLGDLTGILKEIRITQNRAEYLVLENGLKARLDRIIVLNGIPGPAYDEYDDYASACLDCMGGMD